MVLAVTASIAIYACLSQSPPPSAAIDKQSGFLILVQGNLKKDRPTWPGWKKVGSEN
jgi:hypothetical protein